MQESIPSLSQIHHLLGPLWKSRHFSSQSLPYTLNWIHQSKVNALAEAKKIAPRTMRLKVQSQEHQNNNQETNQPPFKNKPSSILHCHMFCAHRRYALAVWELQGILNTKEIGRNNTPTLSQIINHWTNSLTNQASTSSQVCVLWGLYHQPKHNQLVQWPGLGTSRLQLSK